MSPPAVLLTPGAVALEHRLFVLLVQLTIIIIVARLAALLFRRLGQPAAVGELAAGLALGPSLLGWLLPGVAGAIFPPDSDPTAREVAAVLDVLAQLGLILLLFLVGLEFDFGHLRAHRRAAAAVSLLGILAPFALGWFLAPLLEGRLETAFQPLGFRLFMGTAMSITALPMLGRMMQELGITRTRLAAIAISAAALGDAAGWILLAAVTAVVRSEFEPRATALMVVEAAGFALLMIHVARPLLRAWARRALRGGNGEITLISLTILLAVLFACALATSAIGIFAIFGAFLLGSVLSAEQEFRAAVHRLLGRFVTVFFLPIFFTYTGLRTDIGSLQAPGLWLGAGLVVAAAVAGKLGGCALAARLGGLTGRDSVCVGAMMNTRGLMELIVANAGRDLGVIPPSVFCMLVLMALVTTVMTTPLLLAFQKGTDLEPHLRRWRARQDEGAGGE